MATQSEQELEQQLVSQLKSMGYEYVSISNEEELKANLKKQIEALNNISLSIVEFTQILHHLQKGSIFEKAKTLRSRFCIHRDDGTMKHIQFLDSDKWCKNLFQVSQQISMQGIHITNRYDLTLLINGFPLVQIELKRRGIEIQEAFHQVCRYQRHSYGTNKALFQYIQVFIISNGVNTKYYVNNQKLNDKQTFFWTYKDNAVITKLEEFTNVFLEKCHISKMICRYIVLSESQKSMLILRPYQFYAVESIVDTIQNTNNNGYIWHTTGSGKTLTSFKASQILTQDTAVDKVLFVVDRKDLDYQTSQEFNSFSEGSVDSTENTRALVQQLQKDNKLIITTIQKFNRAIQHHAEALQKIKDKKIVFIFDECHRSQFGVTHKNITSFFTQKQLIGFTGTPIFEENSQGNEKTTTDVFGKSLHRYTTVDAIKDENVLPFSVEYIGRYKENEKSKNSIDIQVEDIDTKEFLKSDKRIEKIVEYILEYHTKKTYGKKYSAILCVSSIEELIRYYALFKKKEHDLNIVTIFSCSQNEEEIVRGNYSDRISTINTPNRDELEKCIQDYNKMFNTQYSAYDTESFYDYYNDVSNRLRKKEIDILIVVSMFLTGFDSKLLNTLYVDKNMQYHGLIQAFSRTNRIHDKKKDNGNIVCFRNLKQKTDEAIILFSNKDAKDIILLQPYQYYIEEYNKAYDQLVAIAPSIESVDDLKEKGEEAIRDFVTAFRTLMRIVNKLSSFSDFTWDDLSLSEQEFNDYSSKYLDIYDTIKGQNHEKESIIDAIDFELQLIQRDNINVDYILRLLSDYFNTPQKQQKDSKEKILNIIDANIRLRSKKELIEQFIQYVQHNTLKVDSENITEIFQDFVTQERETALTQLCTEEQLNEHTLQNLINNYLYNNKFPLLREISDAFLQKLGIKEREIKSINIQKKLYEFINIYYE